ncbi:class I SAM-dependent methyltransferase [Viridibacillus sp. YIM B01967]|uniref:Class I SAM-dependent methyltransferase n=1 Tax=Viridibacillus soli TaxID=2798301 RepID=A0ABS1H2A4_9BACL|nr:class I SAM-dependent methyltransferase [Viridibacillus soli]MBK3493530.1 class I SAM-dependent methyltransferase [Viridibacillus soli]
MSLNIFEGNLEKYTDPKKYDEQYSHYQQDLKLILEYAAHMNEPIIDLACGTGRLTIPMAKLGFEMYGVDIHNGMLNHAKKKAETENLYIQFLQQDCTKLSLPIKSPFIFMTGNSFQHFLTNESQDDLFTSVKEHLQPKGTFIFDTRNPILHELAVVDETEEKFINKYNQLVIEKHHEEYDHHTQVLHCTTTSEIIKNEKLIDSKKDSISLRYTFPLELERLLNSHDFELVEIFGSWNKTKFDRDSTSMVVHCCLRD